MSVASKGFILSEKIYPAPEESCFFGFSGPVLLRTIIDGPAEVLGLFESGGYQTDRAWFIETSVDEDSFKSLAHGGYLSID
jgi:hypothetical protein